MKAGSGRHRVKWRNEAGKDWRIATDAKRETAAIERNGMKWSECGKSLPAEMTKRNGIWAGAECF